MSATRPPAESPRPVAVAVVDDDDITRTGTVALLACRPGVEVVAALNHDEALDPARDWAGVDVAVVDASDRRRDDDHFPGVAVVAAIRRQRPRGSTTIVVLTGVVFDDAVRRRMREAGADFYYHRSAVTSADALADAVLRPAAESVVPEPRDERALDAMGVTSWSHVNAGVDAARVEGLLSGDAALARRGRDRTRRRERFNTRARLTPRTVDGREPDRPQESPSLPQIDRFLRWATRLREPEA